MTISTASAYGHTGIGFVCTVISNAVNVIGIVAGIYIFHIQPENGVWLLLGSALAADAIGFFLLLGAVKQKKVKIAFSMNMGWIRKIFHIGFPASVADISYTLSVALTTVITSVLSDDLFNLNIYITNITYFGHAFGTSLAFASAILVGRYLGMGEVEKLKKCTMRC